MANLTQDKRLGDVLRREALAGDAYCREVKPIKTSVAVDIGTVLHLDTTAVAATDQVTVVDFGGTPDGGTFSVGLNGEFVAAQAYNVSTSALQTALEGLAGVTAGDVVVTGTAGDTYTLTFASGLAAQAVTVEVDNEVTATSAQVALTINNTTEGVAAGTAATANMDLLNVAGDGALASAIALQKVAATDTDRNCLCLVRGPAVVKKGELAYDSGTAADADVALVALGILPRD